MAVVDAVLGLAPQPLHRLHEGSRVPDLDLLGTDAHLDHLADQPRRHRIGVVLDPDGTAPAHLDPLPLRRLQLARRQGPQLLQLRGQPLLAAGVAAGHHRAQQLLIGRPAGEVATAAQQQRLLQGLLEAAVALLAVAVLVPTGRVGRLGVQPVMGQQRPVAGRVLLGAALVVHGQGHAIGAVPLGHATQLPQGVLQPLAEAGETLGEAHADVLPVGVSEHEVVDQVGERLPRNGHSQAVHVREVRGGQPARLMHLGEKHFLGRAVLGLPPADAPLQRPPAALPRLARELAQQPLQQGLGLQARRALEQFLQARPDLRQRVGPGPPGARRVLRTGQRGLIPILPSGLAIHASSHRGLRQRCPPQQSFAQFLDLGVGGASAGPHRQLLLPEVAAVVGHASGPVQIHSGEG
jgi:hypothetical protein